MLISFLTFLLLAPAELDGTVSTFENSVQITSEIGEQDTYSVIGRTKKMYGQNYTINLRVTASCFLNSCSIYKVEYASDYGYTQVRHQMVIGQAGTYTVSVNGETYYFDF